MIEAVRTGASRNLLIGALAALAAGFTWGCGPTALEIPIETPIQPKLDVTPFERVLVFRIVDLSGWSGES